MSNRINQYCLFILLAFAPTWLSAQALQVTVSAAPPSCNGFSNGEATATVTGGTAPYSYSWSNGQSNGRTVYGIKAGSYSLIVTDNLGAKATSTFILLQPDALVAADAATGTVCDVNMTRVGSATGGTSPYSYSWRNLSNAQTTAGATLTNPARGSYFLEVKDAKGCVASKVANIEGPLSVTMKTADAFCGGTCDGAADAIVIGGKAPYTYKWNYQNKTTPSIFPIPGGDYSVTVTDANGCVKIAAGTVFEPAILYPNLTVTNACTGSATATVNPTGGRLPYVIKWSNGATGNTVMGLTQGVYYVTVVDAFGCNADAKVSVSSQSAIGLILAKTDAACSGNNTGGVSAQVTGGALGPYSYAWSNGGSPTSNSINNLAAGTYVVTVTDAAGCTETKQITVNNGKTLSLTTNSTNSVCGGNTGSASVLTVVGGTAPFVYKWNNNQTGQTANGLTSGNYTVSVTDAQGCQATGTVSVGATNSAITATNVVTDGKCGASNGSVKLAATGGTAPYTYKYAGGSNTTGSFANLATGTYDFTITDAAGCSFTQSSAVKNTGAVKAAFTLKTNSCNNDNVRYLFTNTSTGATTNATYSWLFTGGRTATTGNVDLEFGTLTADARLIITSTDGCKDTIAQSFNVENIRVDVQDTAASCINSSVKVLATNGNPNFTPKYTWSPANLITAGGNTANPTINPNAAGKTVVYVLMENSLGCSKRDSVVITTKAKDAIKASDISFKQDCNTGKVTFTNNSPLGSQYGWNFGDPANPTAGSNGASPVYTYPNGGSYTAILIPTGQCLDTVKYVVPVRSGAASTVLASNDSTVCNGNTLTLKASSNGAANKIEWSTNKDFTGPLSIGPNFAISPTNTNNVYYARATDANGCVSTIDSVLINNYAIKIAKPAADLCAGINKSVTVTNLNPAVPINVTWTPAGSIDGSNTVLNPVVKATADGTIIGLFTNSFGCTLTDTLAYKVRSVDASATVSERIVLSGSSVTLNAIVKQAGTYTYKWTPVTNANSAQTTATPAGTTNYIVEVTDAFGCKDTGQVTVNVLTPLCDEPFVFIPRAFSPNADGRNDLCRVRGEYLTEVEFAIYNRWGELVFYTTKLENGSSAGWDGTHQNKGVCPDVYGYYVRGKCQKGETFFKKGNITVFK